MALAIAEAGAEIILTGRTSDSLQQTTDDLRQLGRDAFAIEADMSDSDSFRAHSESF